MDPKQTTYQASLEADAKAVKNLSLRGDIDPRLGPIKSMDALYDACRAYDRRVAKEIVEILRTSSPDSSPEFPNDSVRSSRTQNKEPHDWASSAYDR